ncbi:redox-sensitive transcriptional activator SoxR [Seongchinamella sediminis]|uniref:Redox-sensitive transcriptional activator SoxR n=1 Tax=Seongchinamella sediminis TaxID=2283635 RepID=A0A3L7DTE0_9GAMM|nr:redox-sensitive transcriptional activator SoxR [Seongchinamella sediminis]RLQ20336.1 redox-sensitive transcriptional activator SoxR [Seongchinamella sediminis]
MSEASWTPGRVAKRCGVNVSTLHFYEQKGLISSWRNAGNQRRYKADVLRRISVIKAAQKMGISLEEIREALANLPDKRTPNARDWEQLSSHWRQSLNARIAALERLRDRLTGCIGCGCLSMKNCPIYNEDDKLGKEGVGAVYLERESPQA